MFFLEYSITFCTSGFPVANLAWQSIHFRTDGMPAAARVSAPIWQSVHCNPSFMWVLCGNEMGC